MKRLLYLMILVLLSGAIIFLPACSSDESESEELVDNTDDSGEGDDDDSSDGDSDDDDSPSDTGSETAGQLTTSDGETLWITAVGSYVFEYDEGKLVMINDYTLSENPLTATYYSYYDDWMVTCYLTVNSSGYVSRLEIDEDDDYTLTVKYSYNSAGHLTKIEGSDFWVDEDESYSSSGDLTMELTWEGDYLQKSVYSYTYSGEDEDGSYAGSEADTITYEYGDDTYPNVTWQYTPATAYAVDFGYYDLTDGLAFVGYFGKGPSYHPDSCDYEYVEKWDEEEDGYGVSLSFMYSINSDGTVYSYTEDGSTVYFKYADYSSYLSSSSSNTKSLETYEETTTGSSSYRSISSSRMRSRRFTNR